MPSPPQPPTMDNGISRPESLQQLFEQAEAEFPPRFREDGWYLTVLASFIGTGQQKYTGELYKHLVSKPQYQTSAARQALVRRIREALVKCICVNGVPVVVEATMALAEVERPEDRDLSCSRKDFQIGPEIAQRATNLIESVYKNPIGGTDKTAEAFQAHPDIAWITINITYGLYLSDLTILNVQEMELVVLPAIMTQNLQQPTYWHLRGCLRVGIEADEVEAVQEVVDLVAAYGGRSLAGVPRVGDVHDA